MPCDRHIPPAPPPTPPPVVWCVADRPLRWGSAQFHNISGVIGDTADSSTETIGGILATLGIAAYAEGGHGAAIGAGGLGLRLEATPVTHENFEEVASDRLRIVLEVSIHPSISHAENLFIIRQSIQALHPSGPRTASNPL